MQMKYKRLERMGFGRFTFLLKMIEETDWSTSWSIAALFGTVFKPHGRFADHKTVSNCRPYCLLAFQVK